MIETYILIMIAFGKIWEIDRNLTIEECSGRRVWEAREFLHHPNYQFRCILDTDNS